MKILSVPSANINYSLIIILFYTLSRVVLFISGVKFDDTPVLYFWQYIDIDLLKNNLLESLFYLHSQPPLYNLFLGISIKLFPENYPLFFHFVYLLMSLAMYFMLFKILTNYGLKPFLSLVLATVFIMSPEAILYENWLFYTWPLASFLIVSVYLLQRYQTTLQSKYALFFLLAISVMALTRTTFHFIIIVFSIFILLAIPNKNRKKIMLYSLIPVALVLGLYTKNLIIFDTFGSSSWLGMNIMRMAQKSSSNDAIRQLKRQSKISDIALIDGFLPLNKYPSKYNKMPSHYADINVLSQQNKTTNHINLNHYAYIKISKDMKTDAIFIIKKNLSLYIQNAIASWGIYSKPSWDYPFIQKNYEKIKAYTDFFTLQKPRLFLEKAFLGEINKSSKIHNNIKFPYSSLLLIPLSMVVVSIYFVSKSIRDKKIDYVFLYMIFIVFSLAIIGNSLETGENNRFRVMTDPLLYILVILTIHNYIKKPQ